MKLFQNKENISHRYDIIPVCGSVVAVVRQKVIHHLPEHMTSDPPIRNANVVVGLLQHVVEMVQPQVLAEKLMGQTVDFQ